MWTDYQRHRQSHNSPGSSGVFTDGIVFSLLHAGFFCRRLSFENRFDPLYIRARGLHLSFFHFQDLDIRLSCLLIGSSTE